MMHQREIQAWSYSSCVTLGARGAELISSEELEYALAPRIRGFRILRYFVHVFTNGIFELANIDRMREEPVVHGVLWIYDDLEACACRRVGPEGGPTGASFDCDVVVEDHDWSSISLALCGQTREWRLRVAVAATIGAESRHVRTAH